MNAAHRPTLHARPRTGWVNDPNGIGFWDGRWHLMCQHNPAAAVWGDIAWAHLSSPDLIHWREEPIALRHRPGDIDALGAWSGVALAVDSASADAQEDGAASVPVLVYTAVPEAGTGEGRVAIAEPVPGDPTAWRQPTAGVTPPAPPDVRDVRDPYFFEWKGRRLAIQGAGTTDGTPLVLVYDASDLGAWRYLGRLLTGADPLAAEYAPGLLWECPQLVHLGEEWVLILSLWNDQLPDSAVFGPQRVAWLTGSLTSEGADSPDGVRFVPQAGGRFDSGTCVYAPQVVTDPHSGRSLAWAWAWEGTRNDDVPANQDWAGLITFPRVLEFGPRGLTSRLAPEVLAAFDEPVAAAETAGGAWLAPTDRAWIASTDGRRAAGEQEGGAVRRVVVDVVDVATGEAPLAPALTPLAAGSAPEPGTTPLLELTGSELVVTGDASLLEAFVDGEAHTVRAYLRPGERFRVRALGPDGGAAAFSAALADPAGWVG